jgi:prolyl-tRNA synthetase
MAAEIVMVPFEDDDPLVAGGDDNDAADGDADANHAETCAICGDPAERTAYFAKSY